MLIIACVNQLLGDIVIVIQNTYLCRS